MMKNFVDTTAVVPGCIAAEKHVASITAFTTTTAGVDLCDMNMSHIQTCDSVK